MTSKDSDARSSAPSTRSSNLFGYYAAIATAVLTVVTFGFAINAIPISGANCVGDCIDYPYLNTVGQFPKDFIWMPLAMMLVLAYVTLMVSIHAHAPSEKKIFSQAGLAFALMAAVVLLIDYFVQFSVVPVSLMNNETEGLPLLIQYNSHGVFIALEELGYILMALSFLFMAPVFARSSRTESAIRWIFIIAFNSGAGCPGGDLYRLRTGEAGSLRGRHHLHRLAGLADQRGPSGYRVQKAPEPRRKTRAISA